MLRLFLLILPLLAHAGDGSAVFAVYRQGGAITDPILREVESDYSILRVIDNDVKNMHYNVTGTLRALNLLAQVHRRTSAGKLQKSLGAVPAVFIERVLVRVLAGDAFLEPTTRLRAGVLLDSLELFKRPRDENCIRPLGQLIYNITQNNDLRDAGLLPFAARSLLRFDNCEAKLVGD